jgi:hypothetical protein
MATTHFPNYTLGAKYCRKSLKQGGVCIYVHECLKFSSINLLKHNKEQDMELRHPVRGKGNSYSYVESIMTLI